MADFENKVAVSLITVPISRVCLELYLSYWSIRNSQCSEWRFWRASNTFL